MHMGVPFDVFLQSPTFSAVATAVQLAWEFHTCLDSCKSGAAKTYGSSRLSPAVSSESKSAEAKSPATKSSASPASSNGKPDTKSKSEVFKWLSTKEECTQNAGKFPSYKCNLCSQQGHVATNCPERKSDVEPKPKPKHSNRGSPNAQH